MRRGTKSTATTAAVAARAVTIDRHRAPQEHPAAPDRHHQQTRSRWAAGPRTAGRWRRRPPGPAASIHQDGRSPPVAKTNRATASRPTAAPGTSGQTWVAASSSGGATATPAAATRPARAPNRWRASSQVTATSPRPKPATASRKTIGWLPGPPQQVQQPGQAGGPVGVPVAQGRRPHRRSPGRAGCRPIRPSPAAGRAAPPAPPSPGRPGRPPPGPATPIARNGPRRRTGGGRRRGHGRGAGVGSGVDHRRVMVSAAPGGSAAYMWSGAERPSRPSTAASTLLAASTSHSRAWVREASSVTMRQSV